MLHIIGSELSLVLPFALENNWYALCFPASPSFFFLITFPPCFHFLSSRPTFFFRHLHILSSSSKRRRKKKKKRERSKKAPLPIYQCILEENSDSCLSHILPFLLQARILIQSNSLKKKGEKEKRKEKAPHELPPFFPLLFY